jgi:hydroxymethylglutaryl-CoA lyase
MATIFGQARDYAASTAPLPFAIPKRVTNQEIVPRDGLQREPGMISTPDNIAIVDALSATDVPRVQLTAFVRPDAVAQLFDAPR